jgi:hypothetical protein
VLVVALTFFGAQRLRSAGPHLTGRRASSPPRSATPPRSPSVPPTPSGHAAPAVNPPRASASPEEAATALAARWVDAVWTRRPGDTPFSWLERVADITAPGLVAQLRTARPTLTDAQVRSASVDVDGAYPDALDPHTITVTCVAHLVTTAGPVELPCATTVTVIADPDGRLVVSGVE